MVVQVNFFIVMTVILAKYWYQNIGGQYPTDIKSISVEYN